MGKICKTCGKGARSALDAVKGKSVRPPRNSEDSTTALPKQTPKKP